MEDGWALLSEAIVLQAAEDYRTALRALRRRPDLRPARRRRTALERFFRSRWFSTLSGLDPERLISALREEAEPRDKRYR